MEIRQGTIGEVEHFGLFNIENEGDIYVAVRDGVVVGFAQMYCARIGFIETEARGAGTALVAYLCEGRDYVEADNVCQQSEGFWKRMGFQYERTNTYGQPVWTWYAE